MRVVVVVVRSVRPGEPVVPDEPLWSVGPNRPEGPSRSVEPVGLAIHVTPVRPVRPGEPVGRTHPACTWYNTKLTLHRCPRKPDMGG